MKINRYLTISVVTYMVISLVQLADAKVVQGKPDLPSYAALPAIHLLLQEDGCSAGYSLRDEARNCDHYVLNKPHRVSAGIFDRQGRLLKTIFSNVHQSAGLYTKMDFAWDGLDEFGQNVQEQADHIKVLANNIVDEWEGVIGNTSDSFTGETVHRQLQNYIGMVIANGKGYFIHDYTEREGSVTTVQLDDIQKRIQEMPSGVQQATNQIATDGVRIYMGGRVAFSEHISYVQAAELSKLGNFRDYLPFKGETVKIFNHTIPAVDITIDNETISRITGLAVQKTGNWLFVARDELRSLRVLHKISGEKVQEYEFTEPKHAVIDTDEKLWMVVDEEIVKFDVSAHTGAITPTGFKISGFQNIRAMDISPDGATVAVAEIDVDGRHRVLGYDTLSGDLRWSLGRNESYEESPTVYDDKFLFKRHDDDGINERGIYDVYSFLTFEPDGSLWVGDRGNQRYLKFDVRRNLVSTLMWMPAFYNVSIDPNNPSRVFGGYLEFDVDYSKPLLPGNANKAWRFVRNWGETAQDNIDHAGIRGVTTLRNGRTYGVMTPLGNIPRVYELDIERGLRDTGARLPNSYPGSRFKGDGTVYREQTIGNSATLYKQDLRGFDVDHNPVFSDEEVVFSYPVIDKLSTQGRTNNVGEFTSSGIYAVFNSSVGSLGGGNFKLAGFSPEANEFQFRTSKGQVFPLGTPFPQDGRYDDVDIQQAGNIVQAFDSFLIWGYNGEFWNAGQTNRYNLYHESGLHLTHFGTDTLSGQGAAFYGMAGNAFSWDVVKVGPDYYLWTCDEGYHAGVHRWKLTNMESIREFRLAIN